MEVISAGTVLISVTAYNLALGPQRYALAVQGAISSQLQARPTKSGGCRPGIGAGVSA